MGLYGWDPAAVWRLTLSDALRYERARMRVVVLGAQVLAACIWSPLSGASERAGVERMLARLAGTDERPRTLAEKFGPTIAREVAELDERNKRRLVELRERTRRGNAGN